MRGHLAFRPAGGETGGVGDAGDECEADQQTSRSAKNDAQPGVKRVGAPGSFYRGREAGGELVDDGDAGRMNPLDRVFRDGIGLGAKSFSNFNLGVGLAS